MLRNIPDSINWPDSWLKTNLKPDSTDSSIQPDEYNDFSFQTKDNKMIKVWNLNSLIWNASNEAWNNEFLNSDLFTSQRAKQDTVYEINHSHYIPFKPASKQPKKTSSGIKSSPKTLFNKWGLVVKGPTGELGET